MGGRGGATGANGAVAGVVNSKNTLCQMTGTINQLIPLLVL